MENGGDTIQISENINYEMWSVCLENNTMGREEMDWSLVVQAFLTMDLRGSEPLLSKSLFSISLLKCVCSCDPVGGISSVLQRRKGETGKYSWWPQLTHLLGVSVVCGDPTTQRPACRVLTMGPCSWDHYLCGR